MSRTAREKVWGTAFEFLQRVGIHVTPSHFYEPVPDTRKLPPHLWLETPVPAGIDFRLEAQLDELASWKTLAAEYNALPLAAPIGDGFFVRNGFFESVDAEALYCLIRKSRPRNVLEVGGGYSSLLIQEALVQNKRESSNYNCTHTAVDPYPSPQLRTAMASGGVLEERPIETMTPAVVDDLDSGDILFIDSSHVVRIGGDVCFEVLELLPRVRTGVLVHFHDIFLPAEYPKEWVLKKHRFFSEQYLLRAFLTFNDKFEVVWAGHFMHLQEPSALRDAFDSYDPETVLPGSFWIRRV